MNQIEDIRNINTIRWIDVLGKNKSGDQKMKSYFKSADAEAVKDLLQKFCQDQGGDSHNCFCGIKYCSTDGCPLEPVVYAMDLVIKQNQE